MSSGKIRDRSDPFRDQSSAPRSVTRSAAITVELQLPHRPAGHRGRASNRVVSHGEHDLHRSLPQLRGRHERNLMDRRLMVTSHRAVRTQVPSICQ